MTVEEENEDGPLDYNIVKFVEFLEFIGRVAYAKFKDTERHETMAMESKCLVVLQCIFPIIK